MSYINEVNVNSNLIKPKMLCMQKAGNSTSRNWRIAFNNIPSCVPVINELNTGYNVAFLPANYHYLIELFLPRYANVTSASFNGNPLVFKAAKDDGSFYCTINTLVSGNLIITYDEDAVAWKQAWINIYAVEI